MKTGTIKWSDEALLELLKAHRAGEKKSDIARRLGVSRSQAGSLVARAEWRERALSSTDPFDKLSVRARNCLWEYRTVECVRTALIDGKLDEIANLGKTTKEEITQWLNDLSSNACDKPTGAAGDRSA